MSTMVLDRPAKSTTEWKQGSTVSDIFREYGKEYLSIFSERMPSSHRKAIWDIANCRTEAMGGHVEYCSACGYERYSYHSCGNASCPTCSGERRAQWVSHRESELLPVTYHHVVFTLPEELRETARRNQKAVYGAMFKAAAEALQTLARDPKYVGGKIGILSVLHTWTQTLEYHPHLHCIVPGGGLSKGGWDWLPAGEKFFLPLKPLALLFRGKLKGLLKKAGLFDETPADVWNKNWVVYSKPAVNGPGNVVKYLANYVFRTGISNSRIIKVHNGAVTIRHRDRKQKKRLTTKISATEFIRRFLQHVLPFNFVKVRYYGLWSTACRNELRIARHLLSNSDSIGGPDIALARDCLENESSPVSFRPIDRRLCPKCKQRTMVVVAEIPRTARRPFW